MRKHWKRRFPELEEKLLDEYYKFRGWNQQGIPTQKTLSELSLDFVGEDFAKREILKGHDDASSQETSSQGEAP